MTGAPQGMRPARLAGVAFFVAAGLLSYEVSLMRVLLVASWHHFAFLVISIALLGFGASGAGLSILRQWLMPRAEGALLILTLATAAAMPLCQAVAQHVPIEARLAPSLLGRQVAYWVIYWLLLGVPFLLGAAALGLALMIAHRNVGRIYAANLLGSAVGSILAMGAMTILAPQWLTLATGGLVALGAIGLRPWRWSHRLTIWLSCLGIVGGWLVVESPRIRLDPYKYGAYVARLERQGSAERMAVAHGPRAVVEAYRGDAFHDIPFLSVGTTPPPMVVLLADGHLAGSVLEVARPEEAEVVDHTVMSFPYGLLPPRPRVLLLNEIGGTNAWLAARQEAASIVIVQPDNHIPSLLRGNLRAHGGGVLDLPGLRYVLAEPRHFVERTPERFDLIQLTSMESSPAGSGGVAGLGQDHLITVEGISACLARLSDDGLLTVSRGIQTPPRDNVKLLATFEAALRESGIPSPGRHLAVVRDYLAVCTMVRRSPWTAEQVDRIRRTCAARELTPVWFPGIVPDELNQPDEMPGPPGLPGDWYYHAVTHLTSGSRPQFIDEWAFEIRPPTDDRPFFRDFCKLSSILDFKTAFGDLWLTRTELAFLFVLAATVVIAAAGTFLTVLPLLLLRSIRRSTGLTVTLLYFASIGLGYLLLEMTFLSRLTHWIGDPVTAAAVTVAGFLLASGCGSLTAHHLNHRARVRARPEPPASARAKPEPPASARAKPEPRASARAEPRTSAKPSSYAARRLFAHGRLSGAGDQTIFRVAIGILVVGVTELCLLGSLAAPIGSLPSVLRGAAALVTIAPLGYLMGFLMPSGLARLDRGAPALIPWAWGVNGFASVLAAPVAMIIGMSRGFSTVGLIALALYVAAGRLFARLPVQR